MEASLQALLNWLSLPSIGLPAVGIVSFVSATLIPMGSEPTVFAYIKAAPDMFWATIIVATIGNTLGGMLNWWMGKSAKQAKERLTGLSDRKKTWITSLLYRFGPKTLLLSWLPAVGDPMCLFAGWAMLPWRSCLAYMMLGKLIRYLVITAGLLCVPDQFWLQTWHFIQNLSPF